MSRCRSTDTTNSPRLIDHFRRTHPKIGLPQGLDRVHDFRSRHRDEPGRTATGGWFYPRLSAWDGYPAGYRDKLISANFGDATLKIDAATSSTTSP